MENKLPDMNYLEFVEKNYQTLMKEYNKFCKENPLGCITFDNYCKQKFEEEK